MVIGYSFILAAAICWGLSATWARFLISSGKVDAALLSQTRVSFAWAILAIGMVLFSRGSFRITRRDVPGFIVLGVVGIAGANFFLYHAIGQMNAALADLIQFTAPVIVVLWMWLRRLEPLDRPKLVALLLSIAGCTLALGVVGAPITAPAEGVISAAASALCFATVLVLGKQISARHPLLTYLSYSLLFAGLFWLIINPPWALARRLSSPSEFGLLVLFAVTSILLPYLFFFAGLRRVPASRASIVSTFEPVVVALGSWIFLHESLAPMQILGIVFVCGAIILIEATSPGNPQPPGDSNTAV